MEKKPSSEFKEAITDLCVKTAKDFVEDFVEKFYDSLFYGSYKKDLLMELVRNNPNIVTELVCNNSDLESIKKSVVEIMRNEQHPAFTEINALWRKAFGDLENFINDRASKLFEDIQKCAKDNQLFLNPESTQEITDLCFEKAIATAEKITNPKETSLQKYTDLQLALKDEIKSLLPKKVEKVFSGDSRKPLNDYLKDSRKSGSTVLPSQDTKDQDTTTAVVKGKDSQPQIGG